MSIAWVLLLGGALAAPAEGAVPADDGGAAPADAAPADAAPADAAPADAAPSALAELEELRARVEVLEAMATLDLGAPAPPPLGAPAPPPPTIGRAVQSMNPDISFIADFAAAAFSAEEPRMAGGHDPTVDGMNLQQLEMSIGSAVDPYFRFDGNIVFSQFGVEIEEAYGTSLGLPGRLQVRAGQFLTRFGRVNATHPHSWDFVDQTLLIGRNFGGEGNRGLGGELSWLAPLPWSVELIGSQTMAGGASTARSFYGAQDLGVDRVSDLQSTLALKQFFPLSDDWSLYWGLSYAGGPNPSGARNRSELYGTDLYLRFYPASSASNQELTLTAELVQRRRQVPDDIWIDHTGYAAISHHFAPRWGWAARQETGLGARTARGDVPVDTLDPEWTGTRHRTSANITFWPTEFSRLRLQGQRDAVRWEAEPAYAGFLAVEFVTGAHGAHTF